MSQFDVTRRHRVRAPANSAILRCAALLAVMAGAVLLMPTELRERVDASESPAGKDVAGEFTVRVTADQRTLEFSGPIVIGVTDRVREVLDAHPGIRTVRLTSPGGRVVEARELGEIIRARGLATVAAGSCSSACTVIFMAGRDRLLAPAGALGFHRYRSPDPQQEEAEANMAIDRHNFRTQGVPNWFLEQAFATPNSGMWRPSLAEMKVANIVTGELTADGQRIGAPADPVSIKAHLLRNPLYSALGAHEAEIDATVSRTREQDASIGLSAHDAGVRTPSLIHERAARYVRAASDETIVKATAEAAETLRRLASQSADACYRHIDPSRATAGFSAGDIASAATTGETGAHADAQAAGSTTEDLRGVVDRLRAQFGDNANALDRLGSRDVDRAAACGVVTALYEHALRLPAPRNAQLLRVLLAGH